MSESGVLTLIQAGPHTLLQDLGRRGTQHLGFSQSGAIDEHSFLWANKLVGNEMNSPCLEISFGPFECIFSADTVIAITGAANNIHITKYHDDETTPITGWESITIDAGDKLFIAAPKSGLRTYLAVQQGFLFDSKFNSAAMVPKESSGPYNGGCFSKGQQLEYCSPQKSVCKHKIKKMTPRRYIPDYAQILILDFIPNPHFLKIAPELIQKFATSEYRVSQQSNRMAYSLESESPITIEKTPQLSSATPYGTIQIPPNGQPFILLKDRQTIGGYPVLGYVTHIDCFKLGQRRPHQKVRFSHTTLEASQDKLAEFYTFFSYA